MKIRFFNKNILPALTFCSFKNELSVIILYNHLLFALNLLKNHIGFQYKVLSSISGVDFLGKKYRFAVVYELLSVKLNRRLRLKVFSNETTNISSIISVFPVADWWEREVWDLFGVFFENHFDLRRILTDYGFEGHPLRKDFPLTGYIDIKFDNKLRSVFILPVELAQEYRKFNFETPWVS